MIKILPKKAVVNLTHVQYQKIDKAAKVLGLTVPAYLRLKGIEAADNKVYPFNPNFSGDQSAKD